MPILCHCQIQMVRPCFVDGSLWDWVAVWDWVLSIRLAGSWGGSKGRPGKEGCDGTACVVWCGLFSQAVRAAWRASRTAQERSGVSDWISVSCGVAPLESAVSQGRSGAGRQPLFRDFLEKHTSKCCPLKLLCGERHSITLSAAWIWLAEQVVFPLRRLQSSLLRTAAGIISDWYMFII